MMLLRISFLRSNYFLKLDLNLIDLLLPWLLGAIFVSFLSTKDGPIHHVNLKLQIIFELVELSLHSVFVLHDLLNEFTLHCEFRFALEITAYQGHLRSCCLNLISFLGCLFLRLFLTTHTIWIFLLNRRTLWSFNGFSLVIPSRLRNMIHAHFMLHLMMVVRRLGWLWYPLVSWVVSQSWLRGLDYIG